MTGLVFAGARLVFSTKERTTMTKKTQLDHLKASDRREVLTALRDKVAETIDKSESGRDIAALSRRMIEIIDELDKLIEESGDPLDAARKSMGK